MVPSADGIVRFFLLEPEGGRSRPLGCVRVIYVVSEKSCVLKIEFRFRMGRRFVCRIGGSREGGLHRIPQVVVAGIVFVDV